MENFLDRADRFLAELWDKTDTLLGLVGIVGVSVVAGYIGYHVIRWLWWIG